MDLFADSFAQQALPLRVYEFYPGGLQLGREVDESQVVGRVRVDLDLFGRRHIFRGRGVEIVDNEERGGHSGHVDQLGLTHPVHGFDAFDVHQEGDLILRAAADNVADHDELHFRHRAIAIDDLPLLAGKCQVEAL